MKKIQVSTVKMNADVEVINISSYLVAKVMKAHIRLSDALDSAKHVKQEYKEVDESGKGDWVNVLDENGKPVIEYNSIDGNMLNEDIMPLLQELVDAFNE
jgi:hypothetical protein